MDVMNPPLCRVRECIIKIGKHSLETIVGCAEMHCMHMHLEHAGIVHQSFAGRHSMSNTYFNVLR